MAILRAALVMALVGCYAPEAPDCRLACTADTDCISGQTCTTDHLCAANITTCGSQATTDAGMVTLTIHVDKDGSVRDSNNNTCDSPTNMPIDCSFQIQSGAPLTITAYPNGDKEFDKWDGPACMGQPSMCHTTPTGNIMVGAKFK